MSNLSNKELTPLSASRIKKLQAGFGIPLAASTQWDIVEAKAKKISAVYDEFVRRAAQGEVVHNDDTAVKILAQVCH